MRTIASAVAVSDGSTPNEPVAAHPDPVADGADLGDHRAEPVGDLVEVDVLLDRLAEGLVHDRDRPDPADRLLERGLGRGRVDPAGLEAQQRGHGLQVVLHPVVDLADGRVLGHQLAVAAAEVGDVAHQHQRAHVLALRSQRDRAHDQRPPGRPELGVAVHAAAQHRAERLLVRPPARRDQLAGHVGQDQPGQVAGRGPAGGRPTARWGWRRRPGHRRPPARTRHPRGASRRGRCAARAPGSGRWRSSGSGRPRSAGRTARACSACARRAGWCCARPPRSPGPPGAPGSSRPAPARRRATRGLPRAPAGPGRTPRRAAAGGRWG